MRSALRSTATKATCRCDAAWALTETQRQFAAHHHSLIHSFLNRRGLDELEYYDIAAFGYLSAVRRYLTQPGLRRYAFSTVAWQAMVRSTASFHRAETQRREAERRYLEAVPKRDPMEELEARLCLHDLASVASRSQYELAALRLQGCSIAETARKSGMTPKRVSKLLKELYRAYFQLYPNGLR